MIGLVDFTPFSTIKTFPLFSQTYIFQLTSKVSPARIIQLSVMISSTKPEG